MRVLLALSLYASLVVVSGFEFQWLRASIADNTSLKYIYSLSGPALSLFTPMSYFLFALQSLALIPWLLLGALYPRVIWLSAIAFSVTWLGIGWYMHDLF
jgi:hypothetical protein